MAEVQLSTLGPVIKTALEGEADTNIVTDAEKTVLGNTSGANTGDQAITPEGTAVLSTGESGGIKFLREDGDDTCSWQLVPVGSGDLKADGTVPLTANWAVGEFDITIGGVTDDSASLKILSISDGLGSVDFGDAESSIAGRIQYDHFDNYMRFRVNESTFADFDGPNSLADFKGNDITCANATLGVVTGFSATLQLLTRNDGTSEIYFGDVDDGSSGGITYEHFDDAMYFRVGGSTFVNFGEIADTADFNANDITTTGAISGSNLLGSNTGDQDLSGLALKSNVLELDNTDVFTPDADYEPATKKYVDDNAGAFTATSTLIAPTATINPTAASGVEIGCDFSLTVDQSATAGFDAIHCDITSTAYGSGETNFLNLKEDGVSKAKIDNLGDAYVNGIYLSDTTQDYGITVSGFQQRYKGKNGHTFTIDTDIDTGDFFTVAGYGASQLTASSGVQSFINILTDINQSGTAGYNAIHVNVTETQIGSGETNLMDLQVGGVSKFNIDNTGKVNIISGGSSTNPTLSWGSGDVGFYSTASSSIRVSISGTNVYTWTASGLINAAGTGFGLRVVTPSATVPSIVPANNDADTGVGHSGDDELSLIAGAVEGIRIKESGGAIVNDLTGVATLITGHTIATLPTPAVGMIARITDGDSALAWGATAINSGAGTTSYLVWYNGTNWTIIGA